MKKIIAIITLLSIAFASKAQAPYDSIGNYADTTITLQLTQRAAIYIGYYIKNNIGQIWQNRTGPTVLKPYVGTGTHLDSLFNVTVKANYITGLIDLLLNGQNEIVQADRLSIINNSPSISGYTSLASQITTKAGGATSEKNVASYILAYYNTKVTDFANARASIINSVVQWSKL